MKSIKLFSHQKQALDVTRTMNRVAYYLDMGLGKTFVGSEKMKQLRNGVNIVVCQASKVDDWVNHFKTYYENYDVSNLRNKKEYLNFLDLISNSRKRIVGIINYDLVWRRCDLAQIKNFTLMLDESSMIQNPTSKRTKFIMRMKPESVILLSGTPCSGKYENLWTQGRLLGWKINKSAYDQIFVNWKVLKFPNRFVKIVDKSNPYKNVDILKDKLKMHGAVFMKTDDVFDLPQQNIIDVKCNRTRLYTKFKKDKVLIDDVNNISFVGDTILKERLYLRKLASTYNPNKIQSLKDILSSTNNRIIVFYNFTDELKIIKSVCEELEKPISEVNGDVKDLKNYEEQSSSVTLIQYQAGAKGLNLQLANVVVYFSPTEKCEDYMQSMKRIHRIGQRKPCYYYRLISKETIDENIYRALESGEDYTNELFREELKYEN